MHVHVFQHVVFEDEAFIRRWTARNGHFLTRTRFYLNEVIPSLQDIDFLVVLGGPMNVDEGQRYPWLITEKDFLRRAIDGGKTILGICLGAQLLASVLGGNVTRNPFKEIGWFPVQLTPAGRENPLFAGFPASFPAFHWHGDTFSSPSKTTHLAESQACQNQAFLYEDRVLALQFHLELEKANIAALLLNCGGEIVGGPFIQTRDSIMSGVAVLESMHVLLESLLDELTNVRS